jgi:crotonobetaine/carnitine-CoA ligase
MSGKYNFSCAMTTDQLMVVRDGFSLSKYWSEIREHDCVYSQLFPQLGTLLLRQPERPDDGDNPLQFVICYPAFPDVDRFKERFGVKRVSTGFGMTEIGGPIVNRDANGSNWFSSGTLVDNPSGVEVKLVDEHDMEVPTGEPGELVVRTREPWALMAGYYKRPEATAEAWRNGWFHTGDALVVDEQGMYRYVDRMKDCIRRKGENVSSFEVEDAVRRITGVQDVAAVGVPSPLGEEDIKICVVRTPDSTLSEAELVDQLREVMPKFMMPRYVEFYPELPKTAATGRVRKVELKGRKLVTESTWDAEAADAR